MRDFGTPTTRADPPRHGRALRRERFAAGSMGPKVDAVCRFVELTGGIAAIGRSTTRPRSSSGAGTIVTPNGQYEGRRADS